MANQIIAIDLGGTSAKCAFVRCDGHLLHQWTVPTDNREKGRFIVPALIDSIKAKIEEYKVDKHDILGIGMGTPGTVNVAKKTVKGAYNLNWIEDQEIGQAFEQAFNLPFYLDNDANVAALGEQWQGAGQQMKDIVMITLGTGVGGGIVIDNQLVHGISGAAGEFGHITVDPHSDQMCTCGKKGCLEAFASATGIVNMAEYFKDRLTSPSPLKTKMEAGETIDSKMIFDAAKNGDALGLKIIDQCAFYLALGCSHLINILNPGKIVIGGGVSQAGDFLLDRVREKADAYLFPPLREKAEIVLAQLGNEAGILGAAQIVNLAEGGYE